MNRERHIINELGVKSVTKSKCTALVIKHSKTAIHIFTGGQPRDFSETLIGSQKSTSLTSDENCPFSLSARFSMIFHRVISEAKRTLPDDRVAQLTSIDEPDLLVKYADKYAWTCMMIAPVKMFYE